MAADWEVAVERVDGRVTTLQAAHELRVKEDETKWSDNRATHKDLYTRTERPQWLFVWMMGVMGSALGALAMYAILGK